MNDQMYYVMDQFDFELTQNKSSQWGFLKLILKSHVFVSL
jgi:hypothetical protein